jgi:hypothetical protein
MLHHPDPAVVGGLLEIGLAFLDVLELNLLEFLRVGIERRAGVGIEEEGFAAWCLAVTGELVVGVSSTG